MVVSGSVAGRRWVGRRVTGRLRWARGRAIDGARRRPPGYHGEFGAVKAAFRPRALWGIWRA